LPDLKGKFAVAATNIDEDVFETMGQTGGETAHQLTVDEIPGHTHSFINQVAQATPFIPPKYITFTDVYDPLDPFQTQLMDIQSFGISGTTDSTGGDEAHNTLPPYLVLATAQIKY